MTAFEFGTHRGRKICTVYLRGLKRFVQDVLPRDSVLRELILREEDEISGEDYLVKATMWLKMIRIEARARGNGRS